VSFVDEFAGVEIMLGDGEVVVSDGFEIGVAVLEAYDERDGHVGPAVGAEAGLESCD